MGLKADLLSRTREHEALLAQGLHFTLPEVTKMPQKCRFRRLARLSHASEAPHASHILYIARAASLRSCSPRKVDKVQLHSPCWHQPEPDSAPRRVKAPDALLACSHSCCIPPHASESHVNRRSEQKNPLRHAIWHTGMCAISMTCRSAARERHNVG